ncbi:MAG: 4Fe-4S binding protein, partial [Coriobacteriales bacterium]
RVWCRALCPLGGFYEAVGTVGQVNVKIDHEACIGCDACKRACLCDPEILDPALAGTESFVSAGDCMACGKCVDACPTNALKLGLGRR